MYGLGLDSEVEANSLIDFFKQKGCSHEEAKKCAIKVLREKIEELELIDAIHCIGLKARMDIHRQTILHIIEL